MLILVSMMLVVACAVVTVQMRTSLLRAMGRFLIATERLQPADVIVLAVDSGGAGVLEATDLLHAHLADRIALFVDPPDSVDREFLRRGVPYHNTAAISVAQLHELGIDAVEVIPTPVTGTNDESRELSAWCRIHGYRTVILVSTLDHTRRAVRILARMTRSLGPKTIVRGSRYSDFDPDTWWRSRQGVRIEIVESEKLLADMMLHPFS